MRKSMLIAVCGTVLLSACAQPGADLKANVYQANQVNQQQEAKVVNILAVLPAQVEADNSQNQAQAQVIGGLVGLVGGAALGNSLGGHHRFGPTIVGGAAGATVGSAAGSLVPSTALVDGVSLTYVEDGKTLNSVQVGRACEFKPGNAIVVSTSATETRIQANATCPAKT